jgi:hypothetical protein
MGRVSLDAAMLVVSALLLGVVVVLLGGVDVAAPVLLWGKVPVVPIEPPAGLCCPAAVAGFAGAVVGGVPCAKAEPASAKAVAARSVERRVMEVS